MVKRVHILVEGPTEEAFVSKVLQPHLSNRQIYIDATSVCTKRVQDRRQFRGGGSSYQHIRKDLLRLLKGDPNACAVTTMFDFYAFPGDLPGYDTQPQGDYFIKAGYLERKLYEDIGDSRLIPNLIIHEFEALLFSHPECIADAFQGRGLNKLKQILASYESPETINDSPSTIPSQHLLNIYPNYQKILHCSLIAPKIELNIMRNKCNHFNDWIARLESL